MPVLTIQVRRVDERHVRMAYQRFKRKFDVWPVEGTAVYQTFDAWVASLCQRAQQTGRGVTLHTRETKWGWDIVKAELVSPETEGRA